MQSKHDLRVSIFMTAYNHASFIGQAIEGVMMQKTDFPIKLFIGEDCSTDGTREICQRYKEEYPDKIDLILREKNLGASANSPEIYERCFSYGDYTAMCEGDDYWTNPHKLQKQVDFLEANPDFAICFHNTMIVYEDGSRESHLFNVDQKEVTTFEDLASGNYIQTVSCVYRNNLFGAFPDWCHTVAIGDWILHLLNAQHGKIKFMNDAMATYRIHGGGMWGSKAWEYRVRYSVQAAKICKKRFAPRGDKHFNRFILMNCQALCHAYFDDSSFSRYREYYWKILKAAKHLSLRTLAVLTLRYFLSYFPPLAMSYKSNLGKLKRIHQR